MERAPSSDNDEEAIQEGCEVFMRLVYYSGLRSPAASCIEVAATGPPVEIWTCRAPSPVPDWNACHD